MLLVFEKEKLTHIWYTHTKETSWKPKSKWNNGLNICHSVSGWRVADLQLASQSLFDSEPSIWHLPIQGCGHSVYATLCGPTKSRTNNMTYRKTEVGLV